MRYWIACAAAGIGGFLGWFLGGMDGLVYALITLVIVDFIAGVMKGIAEKELSSQICARGIFKKIMVLLLVGVANIIDIYLIRSDGSTFRSAVIFFYLANEGISILESACALGLPVPENLKEILKQFKGKGGAE